MANMLIPIEERNLTPEQVDQLDRRRRRGQTLWVIGWQTLIISVVLTLWSGQDLTYSPGWNHWMFYWNCLTGLTSLTCFVWGIQCRRGLNEFFSY
jgi:hypothetical protein